MKKYIFAFIVAILSSCQTSQDSFMLTNGILVENIHIISAGETGVVQSYVGYILTDESKIIYCGTSKPKIEGNFQRLNGEGKYAIPGLIDSHVHLNNIAGINFRQRKSKAELVKTYFERLPKNFLYFGYTSLIDVDNYAPDAIDKLKKSAIRPEIYTCAQKVQIMDDFEMVMNESSQNERYQTPFLHDKYNKNLTFPDSIALEEHTVSSLVSKIAQTDNICIKTLYEDASSGLKQTWELPTHPIIQDLVTEAHTLGLPVIMHATSYEGQKFAFDAGVDIVAHAMWNWTADPKKFVETKLPETHQKLLLQIAKKGIGYQPTFRAVLAEKDVLDNTFQYDKTLELLYTPKYIAWLQSEGGQWSRNKMLGRPAFLKKTNPEFFNPIRNQFSSDEEMFEEIYQSLAIKIQKVVKLLAENKANLLFGTDNGAMNMPSHPPGYNGYLEMQHWNNAGVPLVQLFKAATYNNAKQFNLLQTIGTLSSHKTANMLILNSNPLETVSAYNDIQYVLINGVLIEREKLTVR